MTSEFKSLWQLNQEGFLKTLAESAKSLIKIPSYELNSNTINEQIIIGIMALIIIGIIFLPFGATDSSIKACQSNTNQKVVKLGGAIIIAMTSISAILFLEILELSEALGGI